MPVGCIALQDCGIRITGDDLEDFRAMSVFPISIALQISLNVVQDSDDEGFGGHPPRWSRTP